MTISRVPMKTDRRIRALSIAVSLAALLLIAHLLRSRGEGPESVRLVDIREDLTEILRERKAAADGGGGILESGVGEGAGSELDWVPLRRTDLEPEEASRFIAPLANALRNPKANKIFHPRAYFVHKPGWRGRMSWPEHPRGGWQVGYSQAGFRNPYEPADPPPRMRVVLCGDSHLEGVLPYEETASALLEKGLRPHVEGGSVEVLNGAAGGYNFYNYVGFLERCLPLRPDVFVLVIYGGNDFIGMIPLHAYFERETLDLPDPSLMQRMASFPRGQVGFLAQSLRQTLHFKDRPRHAELSLEAAIRAMRDMDALARSEGIALVSAYLPPQSDVRPQDMREELKEAMEAFDLTVEDLGITDRLADRMIEELDAVGIDVHDLRPALRREARRLYWERDHHLNTAGHHVVARELFPLVMEHLPAGR